MNDYNKLIIDGETTQTYIDKLDYSIKGVEKRKEYVDLLLKEPNFFTKFYSNSNNSVENEDVVSRALDIISDYIMNGDASFVSSGDLNKTQWNELSLEAITKSDKEYRNEIYSADIYKPKKQKIYAKDFKDIELKSILNDYKKYKEYLQRVRDKAKQERNGKLKYKCDKIIGSINQDMIEIKNMIKKPIKFKHLTPNLAVDGYLECDYTDISQIKALLCICRRKAISNLGILTYDITKMLQNAKLKNTERKIIEYMRQNEDLTQEEMAANLGFTQQYLSFTLASVAKKLVKYNKELDEKCLKDF